MTFKKFIKLILFNLGIAATNIVVFSKAFFGLSLLTGSALTLGAAWTTILASIGGFYYVNNKLLNQPSTYALIAQKMHSLDDCVAIFEQAIERGDVFDEAILKNLYQLKRYKRKRTTIDDILNQKFSPKEITYQKFMNVLNEVEDLMYINMRSILNKIAAFDVEEYEELQSKGFPPNEVSEEKMKIYSEYIAYVKQATSTNEEILLKLDKLLFEISQYNVLEGGEIQKLPAIVEIDELIKNAKFYK